MNSTPWNEHHADTFSVDAAALGCLRQSVGAEEVNALVGEPGGAGASDQGSPSFGGVAGLFQKFTPSSLEVGFARLLGVVAHETGGNLDDRSAEWWAMLFDQDELIIIGEGDDRHYTTGIGSRDEFPAVPLDESEKATGRDGGGLFWHFPMMTRSRKTCRGRVPPGRLGIPVRICSNRVDADADCR